MRSRTLYAIYLTTFRQVRTALRLGDDERLRAICANVASSSGVESGVSMLAMSDAEQGLLPRGQREVFRVFWRTL